jgi:hypothetical protein
MPEDLLETQYGAELCWAWTKDWLQNERECDDDEHITLEEYLWFRAENHDEAQA